MVTELPCQPEGLTPDKSQAKYTVLRLTKRGLTSFEAMRHIAEALHLTVRQVQCLGLKDEDGVTEQLVSVEAILDDVSLEPLVTKLAQQKHSIELKIDSYTTTPLTVKRLHGNLFRVRLRHMTYNQATTLHDSLQKNPKLSFLNYYDQQRFGLPGGPYVTHKIGEALVHGDLEKAADYYALSGNAPLDGIDKKDIKPAIFDTINPQKKDFFVSAYTSYLWNASISRTISSQTSPSRKLTICEGYTLKTCQDPQIEAMRYLDGYEVDGNGVVQACSKGRSSLVLTNIFVETAISESGGYSLIINFFLPMGCYATMAIKQLLAVRLGL